MAQYSFGAGYVIGKRTDVTNAMCAFFGVTQEWSLDTDQKLVTLIGQNKDPVDVAPGERTITGKIKFARWQTTTFGNMLFGVTPTAAAGFDIVPNENHSGIGATTFTVSSGAAFLQDLGVFYHNTGIALQPVAAAPTAGQYIPGVSGTGTYTIATADESVSGGLDVFYQISTTTQYEMDVNTSLMGTGPTLELDISVPYAPGGIAKKLNFQVYAARISKMPISFKNTGYSIPEMDFTAFANAAGQVMRWAMTE